MSYFQHFNISFALIFQSSCSTLNTIRHWVVMFLFTQKEILPICWVAALSGDNSNHGAPHWNTMIVSLHGVFMLPSCCPFNPWLGYRFISFVCRTTFTPLLSIPLHKLQILFIFNSRLVLIPKRLAIGWKISWPHRSHQKSSWWWVWTVRSWRAMLRFVTTL